MLSSTFICGQFDREGASVEGRVRSKWRDCSVCAYGFGEARAVLKRIVGLLLLALVLAMPGVPVLAHSAALVASISTHGNEVTVRALDVYGAAVPGAVARAIPAVPGGKQGKPVTLKEGPPGSYSGVVEPPENGGYRLTVEVTLGTGKLAELFRAQLDMQAGENTPELLVPMAAIDVAQGVSWGTVVYVGAAVLLVVATGYAWLRQRLAGSETEEE